MSEFSKSGSQRREFVEEVIGAAAKTHVRYLEDITDEVDGFGLEHVEAIERYSGLDSRNAGSFWESASVEAVAEAFREYHRVEWGDRDA